METITPPKQTFMARFERYEPASRDHTAIIAAKECFRLYFYKIVLGFAEKTTPQYFKWGTAYHKFREILEREYQKDKNYDNPEHFQAALDAALKSFGPNDPPAGSRFDFQTQARLQISCVAAFKDWKKEKKAGKIEVLGIEMPFEVYLSDGRARRGGKADQFIRFLSKPAGRDWKTSSQNPYYYERSIDPNDQFTGYMFGLSGLAQEFVSMLLVDVLFNKKATKSDTGGPTIRQYMVTKTPWQMEKWEEEQILFEKLLNQCREEDIWPQEEKNCKYCAFHSVCKKGTEAAQMSQLESEFTQKPWDYKTLGDND